MARSPARLDQEGNILLLDKQDRSLWDRNLLTKGYDYLDQSANGEELTSYHLEAAIAWHTVSAPTYQDTNWKNILNYYNLLYRSRPIAIIALNRAVVIGELYGP